MTGLLSLRAKNKAMRLTTLGLLTAILLMAGCKSDQKASSKLFADFFVRYLQDVAEMKAQASFNEGDSLTTAMPKTIQGGVAFQGSGMEMRTVQNSLVRYTIQRRSLFNPPFNFSYQGSNGEMQSYTVPLLGIDSFYVRGDASISKGMTLVLKGAPYTPEEGLVLLFSDSNNNAQSLSFKGFSGNELFIPAENLTILKPGTWKLYLVRKISKIESTPTSNILGAGEFYTRTIDIDVKE